MIRTTLLVLAVGVVILAFSLRFVGTDDAETPAETLAFTRVAVTDAGGRSAVTVVEPLLTSRDPFEAVTTPVGGRPAARTDAAVGLVAPMAAEGGAVRIIDPALTPSAAIVADPPADSPGESPGDAVTATAPLPETAAQRTAPQLVARSAPEDDATAPPATLPEAVALTSPPIVGTNPPLPRPMVRPAATRAAPGPRVAPPSPTSTVTTVKRAASAPPPVSGTDVREAQVLLARLGYNVGAADGHAGPRTRSAVRAFQISRGQAATGEVSPAVLAALRAEVTGRRAVPATTAPAPPPSSPATWAATATRQLQRLLGRNFDSVRRPEELRAYCRDNRDSWIYDDGRAEMVYCGDLGGDRQGGRG